MSQKIQVYDAKVEYTDQAARILALGGVAEFLKCVSVYLIHSHLLFLARWLVRIHSSRETV